MYCFHISQQHTHTPTSNNNKYKVHYTIGFPFALDDVTFLANGRKLTLILCGTHHYIRVYIFTYMDRVKFYLFVYMNSHGGCCGMSVVFIIKKAYYMHANSLLLLLLLLFYTKNFNNICCKYVAFWVAINSYRSQSLMYGVWGLTAENGQWNLIKHKNLLEK